VRKRACCLCKLICPIIFAKIACAMNYLADEARARYVQEKMAMVELMEEEDTSRLSELIALAEAGLHGEEEDDTSRLTELIALAKTGLHAQEEEDKFMSQAIEEVEAAYYKHKCDEVEAEDQLFSQGADEA
jgi:aminopeptidase N